MSEWKEYRLSELCTDISYGYTESASSEPIGPKFLRITDIVPNQIDWPNVPFCKSSNETTEKYRLEIGDIVIARTGATTGYNKVIKKLDYETVFASYLIRYRINKEIADPFYVGHILQSSLWMDYVNAIAGGSAQPGANAKQLGSFDFLLPPLPEQKAIAEVLSSLDDKIDLLHRQNKTLEAMAEALFRQWFVEEMEDEENIELGSVINTASGGTPSRNNMNYYLDGTVDWVKSKELNGTFILDTEEKITIKAISESSAKILPENSILIAMYGATVGAYGIISKEMACNQAICALLPNENYPYTYLFMLAKSSKNDFINMAVGSAQQNISQILIKQMNISNNINKIKEYNKNVNYFFQKIKINLSQIRTLEKLRDTLLPKLMNGEVKVSV
jgi:type I restriction enzyme S subunit